MIEFVVVCLHSSFSVEVSQQCSHGGEHDECMCDDLTLHSEAYLVNGHCECVRQSPICRQ